MKNLIIALCLCCFLYGCSKKEEYDYIADEAKPYAAFAEGSSWIFQNDSTLLIDSLVSSYGEYDRTDIGDNRHPHYVERFTGGAWSKLDTSGSIINFSYWIENRIIVYYFFGIAFKPDASAFPSGLTSVGTDLRFNYFDKLILNGIEYEDVYQIEESSTNNNITSGEIYLAKNVGLIKLVLSYNDGSSESWSLLRNHTAILYN